MEQLETWIPIIISVLALLGGTGWLRWYLDRRNQQRERYRLIHRDFLSPLEGLIKSTKAIWKDLVKDLEVPNLEYDPRALRRLFESLPTDDPRRLLWQTRIDRLRNENRRVLDLVDGHRGDILTDRFRKACDSFRDHALAWEDLWLAVERKGPDPSDEQTLEIKEQLWAKPFPEDLEPALEEETAMVRARARD